MKEIKAYETSDGQVFTSSDQASIHEEHLAIFPIIDQFLNSKLNKYNAGPQRIIAQRTIANWEKWKDENV